MFDAGNVIAWVAAFVALWWLIDWLSLRQEGLRMPLRRGPLRVLADVLPKLWRNKTFLLALMCLWLIGAAIASFGVYLATADPMMAPPGAATPRFAAPLSLTETVPELLVAELPPALPRLVEIPVGGWAAIFLVVLLAAGLIHILLNPPPDIGEDAARALRWPVVLLCVHIVVYGGIVTLGEGFFEGLGVPGAPWYGPWLLGAHALLIAGVLMAPAHALLWRLVLEIARDGFWSFKTSIRAIGPSWAPALVLLVLTMPAVTELRFGALPTPLLAIVLDAIVIALPVLLVFAAWAVVDRQSGLIAALRRSWHLFRQRPVDLIAFGLRFTLLFAVLGGIVALFEPATVPQAASWYVPLLGLVRNGLLLLQALVLARLYVHLSNELAAGAECAGCPGQTTPQS